jgi:hypothetical protein
MTALTAAQVPSMIAYQSHIEIHAGVYPQIERTFRLQRLSLQP